ncbi:MAG: exodeoxyribonuclease VII large subunit [Phycisphaerales bacterium]
MPATDLRPSTPVGAIPGIGPRTSEALGHLGIRTAADLLRHFPLRYEDDRGEQSVADLLGLCEGGESPVAALRVEVASVRNAPRPKPRTEATFEDGTGTVRAVWFNAPWMRGKLHPGMRGMLQGQAKLRGRYLELSNPRWEPLADGDAPPAREARLRPVYPASEEIASAAIERAVRAAMPAILPQLEDPLPAEYRASRALPPLDECVRRMHAPRDRDEQLEARRRLAFEEFLQLQLGVMMKKHRMRTEARAPRIPVTEAVDARIRARFPWPFTGEQDRACSEIAGDVADRRASTPTAAVMLLLPDREGMQQQSDHLHDRLRFLMQRRVHDARVLVERLARHPGLKSPTAGIAARRADLDRAWARLGRAAAARLSSETARLSDCRARLERVRPAARHAVAGERLAALEARLRSAVRRAATDRRRRLEAADRGLRILGPGETLARGWSLTFDADGRLVRRTSDAPTGSAISTRLSDGVVRSRVE